MISIGRFLPQTSPADASTDHVCVRACHQRREKENSMTESERAAIDILELLDSYVPRNTQEVFMALLQTRLRTAEEYGITTTDVGNELQRLFHNKRLHENKGH